MRAELRSRKSTRLSQVRMPCLSKIALETGPGAAGPSRWKVRRQTPVKYPPERRTSGSVITSGGSGEVNRPMRTATGERPVINAVREGTHCGAA